MSQSEKIRKNAPPKEIRMFDKAMKELGYPPPTAKVIHENAARFRRYCLASHRPMAKDTLGRYMASFAKSHSPSAINNMRNAATKLIAFREGEPIPQSASDAAGPRIFDDSEFLGTAAKSYLASCELGGNKALTIAFKTRYVSDFLDSIGGSLDPKVSDHGWHRLSASMHNLFPI